MITTPHSIEYIHPTKLYVSQFMYASSFPNAFISESFLLKPPQPNLRIPHCLSTVTIILLNVSNSLPLTDSLPSSLACPDARPTPQGVSHYRAYKAGIQVAVLFNVAVCGVSALKCVWGNC